MAGAPPRSAAIAVGLAGGWLQGLAITRLKVPPFVVTLGGMSAFRGAALLFAAGGPISGFQPSFTWWGQGKIGPVPVPVIIFLLAALIAHIVLRYTRYGRQVYAVGGNPEAARLSGLNVNRIIMSVYVIMGFFAGLGAFVLAARLNSAEAVAGTGYELTVIASVVIGGTSLFGGAGTIFGTVIGSILIGVLLNGLVLDERVVLHPADHHRRHHRAGGRLRHVRQVQAPEGVRRLSLARIGRRQIVRDCRGIVFPDRRLVDLDHLLHLPLPEGFPLSGRLRRDVVGGMARLADPGCLDAGPGFSSAVSGGN